MWSRFVWLVLCVGCAPTFHERELAHVPAPALLQGMQEGAEPAAKWPTTDWWTSFQDPQLTALEEAALKGSPKLEAALARVRQAMTGTEIAYSARFPQMNVIPSQQLTKFARNGPFGTFIPPTDPVTFHVSQIYFTFNWMIDIWGRVEQQLAAAQAEIHARDAEWAVTHLMLTQQVAQAYLHEQASLERALLLKQRVEVLRKLECLTELQASAHLVSATPVQQMRVLREQCEIALASAERQVAQAHHMLQELVGRPDGMIEPIAPRSVLEMALSLKSRLPKSLPLELLGRRPDVVASRYRVEMLAAHVRIARTAYYPNLDFTGSYFGLQSDHLQRLFQPFSLGGLFGPALTLPWFDGGARHGRYDRAVASYDEAVADYRQAVLQASHEVLDAISEQRESQIAFELNSQSQQALQAISDLNDKLSQGGIAADLPSLQALEQWISKTLELVDAAEHLLQSDVHLQVTLGGGYEHVS